MDNNKDILDEIYKGCYMGIHAIKIILEKTDNLDFKELLDKQIDMYEEISSRVIDIYSDYSKNPPEDISNMAKAMSWYGIQKDTILDNSTSKLADLLLNGTNMGIIEGRKLLNHKNMDKKIHKICSDYVKIQEKYIEKLKKFL